MRNRPRVLMFCPQFFPLVGGAERQAEKLGKLLCAQGMEVDFWTPRIDPDSPGKEAFDSLNVTRFPLHDLSKRFPRIRGIGLINGPWLIAQIIWTLWRAVGRAEVVHCHIGCLQSIAVAITAQLRGVPVICKAAMAAERSDLGEISDAGVFNRMLVYVARHVFTRWVATTEAVRWALIRAGVPETKIVVISNGVELIAAAKRWSRRSVQRFLYLGRLSNNIERDVPGLLLAFNALAADLPSIELAIVGGGGWLEQTRQHAARCAHAERITVPGPGDAQYWLAWADCLVQPSRREGLSNTLLEAMAFGLPCIANDIPSNREVLADGDAGLLVPVGDVAALRDAMARVVGDLALAQSLSSAAAERVATQYSLAFVAARYETLYQDIRRGGDDHQ